MVNKEKWSELKTSLTKSFRNQGFDETIWHRHPLHFSYASNETGHVINLLKKKIIGGLHPNGYIQLTLRTGEPITVRAHRFVYECYHGVIPATIKDENSIDRTAVIDHIDHNRSNNSISNLHLTTQSQNCKNSDLVGQNDNTAKPIWVFNLETGESFWFQSAYNAGKRLNIERSNIWHVLNGNQKTAVSKDTGHQYYFEYDNQSDDIC